MKREPILAVGLALVPFVVSFRILGSACAPLGRTLAKPLAYAGRIMQSVKPAAEEPAAAASADPSDQGSAELQRAPAAEKRGARRRHVEVSAELVRRAVPPEHRPSGQLVGSRDGRPAGIEIHRTGVLAGLVRQGDIILEVEGRPITSWEVLIGTVRAAYDRGAETVDGTMWRPGGTLTVRVHLPR